MSSSMMTLIGHATLQTLYMVLISGLISGVLGLALGLALYTTRPGRFLAPRSD